MKAGGDGGGGHGCGSGGRSEATKCFLLVNPGRFPFCRDPQGQSLNLSLKYQGSSGNPGLTPAPPHSRPGCQGLD